MPKAQGWARAYQCVTTCWREAPMCSERELVFCAGAYDSIRRDIGTYSRFNTSQHSNTKVRTTIRQSQCLQHLCYAKDLFTARTKYRSLYVAHLLTGCWQACCKSVRPTKTRTQNKTYTSVRMAFLTGDCLSPSNVKL